MMPFTFRVAGVADKVDETPAGGGYEDSRSQATRGESFLSISEDG